MRYRELNYLKDASNTTRNIRITLIFLKCGSVLMEFSNTITVHCIYVKTNISTLRINQSAG